MTTPPPRSLRPMALLGLGTVLVVGFAIRLAAIDVPGHLGDVLVVARWAERLAEVGPPRFYDGGGASIYPALLYLYWPLGLAFDGDALNWSIEALSIPFDLAIGVLLFAMVRRAGDGPAVLGAALYVLNPAVILAGPVWGQIDAAGTLAFLGALLAAADRRFLLAGALGMLAGLVKPQFGLVLIPVLVTAALDWRARRSMRPPLAAVAGALGAYLLVAGPLLLTPWRHLENIGIVTDIRPEMSVLAPNPWALLFGYDVQDAGYTAIGAALLLIGLAAANLPLLRRRDLQTLLVVGAFVVFAFYFLPTRVHERYLFPAMAVLAPLAVTRGGVLATYLALTAGFSLSLLYALVDTTPFTLPQDWEEVLVSQPMVGGLSLLLIGAAATVVVQLTLQSPHPDGGGSVQPKGPLTEPVLRG